MVLRDAVEADLVGIMEIYNLAVENTTAIWNEHTVDLANRLDWWRQRTNAGFPVLVAVLPAEERVLGYATYGPFRPHDGYRHSVEHSVYVHPDRRGEGIGGQLMAMLIEHARQQGRHAMIGGIDAGNRGSIRLHERFGFRQVGLMPQVGCKFGRWLDLALLQLTLDDSATPPAVTVRASEPR
ncbi:GNAT family N-acetyltransferase [Kushneria phosphatilytica]|uniref:N-acetyltransferase family protein n=1 Tax=Kushneria phosphatilytica TaxID=657387 RepID=A0A1S1NM47_9GAMM|nr:GNAT family N-acetyltransferase [Kushneria phosphatilytica]QEL12691.1 N-acetyltransferase family protein [Kushneria phosphatilytica]